MPKDKKEPVEKWKLSSDLVKITKAYKERAKLSEVLKKGIQVKQSQLQTMTNALYASEKQQEMLANMVPPERVEIDGTPIPEGIEPFEINY